MHWWRFMRSSRVRSRLHIACAAMALLFCSFARAEAPIPVGVRGGFPLATMNGSGDKTGLYVEVLDAIAAQAGTRFDVHMLPFPRLLQYLKEGRLTAVMAVSNDAMRADSVAVGDVMEFDVVAIGRRGTHVHAIEELQGKRICLTRSSSLVPELFADKRYLLQEVSNHESCPRMLDAGRVDFIISLPIGLGHLLSRMGKTRADFGEPYRIKRVPVQLLVSRSHADPATIQTLRLGLERAKGAGTIAAIQSRYEKVAH